MPAPAKGRPKGTHARYAAGIRGHLRAEAAESVRVPVLDISQKFPTQKFPTQKFPAPQNPKSLNFPNPKIPRKSKPILIFPQNPKTPTHPLPLFPQTHKNIFPIFPKPPSATPLPIPSSRHALFPSRPLPVTPDDYQNPLAMASASCHHLHAGWPYLFPRQREALPSRTDAAAVPLSSFPGERPPKGSSVDPSPLEPFSF